VFLIRTIIESRLVHVRSIFLDSQNHKGRKINLKYFAAFILLFAPVALWANVVWPALYLETRLFSWWAIAFGLLIEFFFVRWLFELSAKKAAAADLAANTVSTIAGLVLIPLAGIAWEFFPGSVVYWAFGWGTFNPVTWFGTFLLASLINTVLEGMVYRKMVRSGFSFQE
jgi:hypothetical protein